MVVIDRDQLVAFAGAILLAACVLLNIAARPLRLVRVLHESGASTLWGLLIGLALFSGGRHIPALAPAAFSRLVYTALLPAIVFHAGLTMRKRMFFLNLGSIVSYAVVGTLVSALCTAGGLWLLWRPSTDPAVCLVFGALSSATDTAATIAALRSLRVDPLLHSLVFGESVLNDAVAIALFQSVAPLVEQSPAGQASSGVTAASLAASAAAHFAVTVVGSLGIALAVALPSAAALKSLRGQGGLTSEHETAVVLLCAYSAYALAQGLELSGIIALFVFSVLASHYHWKSLSRASRAALFHASGAVAFVSDTAMFVSVGLTLFAQPQPFAGLDLRLTGLSLGLVLLSRAVAVFPLSLALNAGRRDAIPLRYQAILWYANLRGAIALILALNVPQTPSRQAVVTATYVLVLVTNVVVGPTTKSVARALRIPTDASDAELSIDPLAENGGQPQPQGAEAGQQAAALQLHRSWLHRHWHDFDERHLKPLFGQDGDGRDSEANQNSGAAAAAATLGV
eukprot:m51a1_g9110 putative sodium hydrogen exchanger 3 (512) ;mRNA; f:111750-113483